ncbi:caspase [Elysia marginata]|uniref:Caspase n=1 Tax=Elysia marginata TaxID=1093978 RepID=A0AAV4J459_9GAST|nr:caspase [Elysia marginata]
MDRADQELLRRNHMPLKKAIAPGVLNVLEDLESCGIITLDMKERTEHESRVPGDQASKLLYLIRTRGKYAFQALYDCTVSAGLFDAADILKPEKAPHGPSYVGRAEPLPSSVPDEFSEDEDLPDCWPPQKLEELDVRVKVKSFQDSKVAERRKKFYEFACSINGQKTHYPVQHKELSQCLIISNEKFDNEDLENRDGTVRDVTALNSLFYGLHFDVTQKKDLKSEDMKKIITDKIVKYDHSKSDSCVVVILSHGADGVVFGTDGRYDENTGKPLNGVEVEWIRQSMCAVPSLLKKPKLIFIQACRGKKKDKGIPANSSQQETGSNQSSTSKEKTGGGTTDSAGQNPSGQSESGDSPNSNGGGCQDSGASSNPREETPDSRDQDIDIRSRKNQICKERQAEDNVDAMGEPVPSASDVFLAWSTTPGYVSYRNTKQGTWFIQALVWVFSRFAYKHNINDLMTKVHNLVSRGEVEKTGYKQTAESTTRLLRTFYFFPKLKKEENL